MITLYILWHSIITTLVPSSALAGSAKAWKDYQAGKNPWTQFLTIAGIVAGGIALFWVLSKVQNMTNKKARSAKPKKRR